MSDLNRREFAAALAAATVLPTRTIEAALQSQAAAINPPSSSALAELPRWLEMGGTPGLSMGIVQNGKLVWERYEGVTDATSKQPVSKDSLFPAASLGKPVAALGALAIVDQGKLDLDRPLKSYVTDHAPADARGDLVTARHVLSHSSGYRNWRNSPDQALLPEFDPGSRFQYSGEGFYYLQRVLESVSGRSFEQFMGEVVFGPLGMKSSIYGWRADTDARLVTGHNRGQPARAPNREFAGRLLQYAQQQNKSFVSFTHEDIVAAMGALKPAPPTLPNFIIPNAAASLLTTVSDYGAFLNALLSSAGATVPLKPGTRKQMWTTQTRINSALSWGLGWGLESNAGREYVWHWGDNGNWKNFVLAHPASRSAIVVFTNGNNGMRVCERLVSAAAGFDPLAFGWL